MSIVTIILCVFLPPVAVFLEKGLGKEFILNLILTLLFFVPGMIHGFYVCSRKG